MISFAVKLLRVPPIGRLSGWDVFELMVNARHVGGEFWIFEGDVESLNVAGVDIAGEGVTEGHGDMDDGALVKHCEEIFAVNLSSVAPSWKMLKQRDAVVR
jgi:hypothetical protein